MAGAALGALGGAATGAGAGGLASALFKRTKVGSLLNSISGGSTPNPFTSLFGPSRPAGSGQVAPTTTSVPSPMGAFGGQTPSTTGPTPTVPSMEFLQPPPSAQTGIAQTRQGLLGHPDQNEGFAFNYLKGRGLSPAAAAGIIGNLAQESSFAPDVLTGRRRGDKGASGFAAQWQGPRLRNLKAFAGTEVPSFEQQLDFIFEEANPKSPYFDPGAGRALAMLQNASNPGEAADIFRDLFERPSAQDRGSRRGFAQRAFARYGGQGSLDVRATASAGAGASPGMNIGGEAMAEAGTAADMGQVVIGGVSRPPPTGRFSQAPLPPGLFQKIEEAKLGGQGGDFAFGGEMQMAQSEQQSLVQPTDLGAQDVGGMQQSLTQKRLGEQQQSQAAARKQELRRRVRGEV